MLNLKNTLDGYLKNVEVIGNTIQDENNLADIRSVGDKVEGQELYKIDIVSCGKNLFDGIYKDNSYLQVQGVGIGNLGTATGHKATPNYVKLRPNSTYRFSTSNKSGVGIILFYYDKNKKYIRHANTYIMPHTTITTNETEHYIRWYSPDEKIANFTDAQIEDNTVATEYEPYKGDKLEILSPVQLEKVGNVADRIICKDGVWGVDKKVNAEVKNNVLVNTRTKSEFIPLPHDQQVKLRTFAGQTNIAFLTEIPGQIKAQVPKSLGATVNTHTEQIADLHNSLERVKKLEETTVSTIETGSSFTTVDATSNGYFEDVKLEGKTLVNLYKNKDKLFNSNHIYSSNEALDFSLLNTHTTYTLVVLGSDKVVSTSMCNQTATQYFYIRKPGNITKFTTPSSFDEFTDSIRVYAYSTSSNGFIQGEEQSIKFILLEGDHTNNPPSYFEGLLSVGQDVEEVNVESVNENLLDLVGGFDLYPSNTDLATYNILDKNTLSIKSSEWVGYYGHKIPIKQGRLYYSFDLSYHGIIAILDSNKKRLIEIGNTLPSEVVRKEGYIDIAYDGHIYIQYLYRNIGNTEGTISNAYISQKTPTYQIHQSNKKPLLYYNPTTETWEKPILRKWDTIEKHSDGKYYYHKRSEEVVLNGSENWGVRLNGDYVVGYMTKLNNMYFDQDTPFGLCDKFRVLPNSIWESLEDKIWNSTHQLQISIKNTKLSTQDVAGFKAWLKANPTTIVYQLAQEEIYECANIDLMTYSGETNYIINSGAISPKSLLKVHNNISNVVKILQEKVSLLENTFIAGLKSVLSGDMYSLATILYPEDFEQNDNTEQDIMVIPE